MNQFEHVNKLTKCLQDSINSECYPHLKLMDYSCKVRVGDEDIRIDVNKDWAVVRVLVTPHLISEKELAQLVYKAFENLKEFLGIDGRWVGSVKISEAMFNYNNANTEIQISGKMVSVERLLYEAEFHDKLMKEIG